MKKFLSLFTGLLVGIVCFAQQLSKEDLQRRNNELAKEIANIRADLDKARGDKKVTLGLLAQLNQSINKRNEVIKNIKGEVFYIEKDIIRTYHEIDTLKKELDTLKVQYAKSIIYAYKNRSSYDFLNFLFSAGSFNDALKRLAYLRTYRQYREQQAGRIQKTNETLKSKVTSLTTKREDKKSALGEQNKQMAALEEDKKSKDQTLNVLKSQESQLSSSIAKKEKQRKQNDATIRNIIRQEIARAEAARKAEEKRRADELARQKAAADAAAKANQNNTASTSPTTAPPKTTATTSTPKPTRAPSVLEPTPESQIVSQEFEKNRGRLPWPVSSGQIIIPFGDYTIPGTKIRGISDGITIETAKGSVVKSIFEGEVLSVYDIGSTQTVIVKHGKYFTTYANLASASVSRGQKISTGQAIGTAGQDDNGIAEVELRVDTEKGPINPALWIRR